MLLVLGTKSGDYHHEMNNENFMKWVQTQLLPNLLPRSVLVIDNASYHNVPVKKNVTSASKKQDIIEWLNDRNIPVNPKLLKPELYALVKEHLFRFPVQYKLDALLEQHGHSVLRLPPYHPELNPIEKIWALVKNWVASRNTTFKLVDVEKLTRTKFAEVTADEWKNICDHVVIFENELIQKEHILDDVLETMQFTVNTGSSEESFSDWDRSDSSLSGVDELI